MIVTRKEEKYLETVSVIEEEYSVVDTAASLSSSGASGTVCGKSLSGLGGQSREDKRSRFRRISSKEVGGRRSMSRC